jgi:hypothetical protein
MKIPVTYRHPNGEVLTGHIVGCSPNTLGVLVMLLANGKHILVDAEFITQN